MSDAADGIDFLNREQGVYHRDIKPQNLLLFHGRVKLADLGLAKFAGASMASHTGSGTFGYLPPEAYEEHRLTPTIDVYSLAATYVRLRTGNHPFGDPANPVKLVQRQLEGRPILNGLDPHERKVIDAALAVRPEDRPQGSARAWVDRLATHAATKSPAAKRKSKTAQRANGPGGRSTDREIEPPPPGNFVERAMSVVYLLILVPLYLAIAVFLFLIMDCAG
jgi:serine/threonine protein kinase